MYDLHLASSLETFHASDLERDQSENNLSSQARNSDLEHLATDFEFGILSSLSFQEVHCFGTRFLRIDLEGLGISYGDEVVTRTLADRNA
jgi:hypothetical protein